MDTYELAGDMYAIWRDEMLAGGWATPNEWPYAGPKMQATWVAIAERTKAVIR